MLLLLLTAWLASAPAHAVGERTTGITLLMGVPHPVNLAIDQRKTPRLSYGGALGALAVPLGQTIRLQISNVEGRGRWHPFEGAFFLGGILGIQTLSGRATQNIDVGGQIVPTRVDLKINSLYFTPHLGWYGAFAFGLTLGFEVGYQFPFLPGSRLDIAIDDPTLQSYLNSVQQTSAYQRLENDLEDTANKVGLIKFPYVTVLRIGWSF